ncbi:hypothetical protein RsoM2USA_273 [Ralstonia phage RsoM2USA]|nr:hypothetical protein RsoM2USA_273 [Ralstonia phage RsoM2USA]
MTHNIVKVKVRPATATVSMGNGFFYAPYNPLTEMNKNRSFEFKGHKPEIRFLETSFFDQPTIYPGYFSFNDSMKIMGIDADTILKDMDSIYEYQIKKRQPSFTISQG